MPDRLSSERVTGHDPETGKELWRVKGLNPDNDPFFRIIASPLVVDRLVIAPTRIKPMLAIKAGGRGDVSATHVAWSFDQGPDVPTPVSAGKLLIPRTNTRSARFPFQRGSCSCARTIISTRLEDVGSGDGRCRGVAHHQPLKQFRIVERPSVI